MLISGMASLSGCKASRATATTAAPAGTAPAPTMQPIDCGTWADCA